MYSLGSDTRGVLEYNKNAAMNYAEVGELADARDLGRSGDFIGYSELESTRDFSNDSGGQALETLGIS